MGYFSNGTEGLDYAAKFCDRCQHQGPEDGPGCAVWEAHMLYNYKQCNDPNSVLHLLIPREAGGLRNGACRMFVSVDKAP